MPDNRHKICRKLPIACADMENLHLMWSCGFHTVCGGQLAPAGICRENSQVNGKAAEV